MASDQPSVVAALRVASTETPLVVTNLTVGGGFEGDRPVTMLPPQSSLVILLGS